MSMPPKYTPKNADFAEEFDIHSWDCFLLFSTARHGKSREPQSLIHVHAKYVQTLGK
jgi:hypothetical protein